MKMELLLMLLYPQPNGQSPFLFRNSDLNRVIFFRLEVLMNTHIFYSSRPTLFASKVLRFIVDSGTFQNFGSDFLLYISQVFMLVFCVHNVFVCS
jgi:hypothetical protein